MARIRSLGLGRGGEHHSWQAGWKAKESEKEEEKNRVRE